MDDYPRHPTTAICLSVVLLILSGLLKKRQRGQEGHEIKEAWGSWRGGDYKDIKSLKNEFKYIKDLTMAI